MLACWVGYDYAYTHCRNKWDDYRLWLLFIFMIMTMLTMVAVYQLQVLFSALGVHPTWGLNS